MTVHRSRGNARPAPARADELPEGVPAPGADPNGTFGRDTNGKILTSEAARSMGRKSGEARRGRPTNAKKWGNRLGLGTLLDDPRLGEEALFRPFAEDSQKWFTAKCAELAATVGGGVCSAGVTSIVRTASWERAFSAYLFELAITKAFAWERGTDKAGNATLDPRLDLASLASKLGDSSRQNLLAAHELCAREAMARKSAPTTTSSAFISKYEAVLQREAEAYQSARLALEQKSASTTSTTVEASPTDTRGVVTVTPPPSPPAASVAAATTSAAPSSPAPAPRPPGGGQAHPAVTHGEVSSTWTRPAAPLTPEQADEEELRCCAATYLANEKRRTLEEAQACARAQGTAFAILEPRYASAQDAERKWRASGARGRMPVPSIVLPWPVSAWWRAYRDGAEGSYSERVFKWVLQPEPERKQ